MEWAILEPRFFTFLLFRTGKNPLHHGQRRSLIFFWKGKTFLLFLTVCIFLQRKSRCLFEHSKRLVMGCKTSLVFVYSFCYEKFWKKQIHWDSQEWKPDRYFQPYNPISKCKTRRATSYCTGQEGSHIPTFNQLSKRRWCCWTTSAFFTHIYAKLVIFFLCAIKKWKFLACQYFSVQWFSK